MWMSPYLSFNGNCREAFDFYRQCLDGEMQGIMTYGETPASADMAVDMQDRIIHARLKAGDAVLMGADAPPEHYQKPQGISLALQCDSNEQAERHFNALSAGGQVTMPLGETFWAHRFGMCVDKFGIGWMVNHEKTK